MQIIGQYAEQVAQSRPTPDSIYVGPRPSIQIGYPPYRDPATCSVVTGSGYRRLYRWNLQADDFANLPDGSARPLSLIDKRTVAAAVVDSQFGFDSLFLRPDILPPDFQRLNEGLFKSLDGFYRRQLPYDLKDEFDIITKIDANTHEHVVVATSRYHDVKGTRLTAEIRFRCPPSAT